MLAGGSLGTQDFEVYTHRYAMGRRRLRQPFRDRNTSANLPTGFRLDP